MTPRTKLIFKWLLGLFLLAVVAVVVFLCSLDPILRVVVQHSIRARTGLNAQIGKFHLGLFAPVIHVENFQLYNPAEFGGTPFLSIPEIHAEYDQPALQRGEIHLTLLRINLGEVAIVKNAAGRTNLFALGMAVPAPPKTARGATAQSGKGMDEIKKQTGLDFKGIDTLAVSVGTLKYVDLQDPRNNREQKIGIENQVINQVRTSADLAGLALLVGLRSGDFFSSLAAPSGLK